VVTLQIKINNIIWVHDFHFMVWASLASLCILLVILMDSNLKLHNISSSPNLPIYLTYNNRVDHSMARWPLFTPHPLLATY